MTQKTMKTFIDAIYSKGLKKILSTNKTDVYYIDDISNLDILYSIDYGPEIDRGYR